MAGSRVASMVEPYRLDATIKGTRVNDGAGEQERRNERAAKRRGKMIGRWAMLIIVIILPTIYCFG